MPHHPERKPAWFDGSGFRHDLRAAWIDATIALVITVLIFVWFHHRMNAGTSDTVTLMPYMGGKANTYWMYVLCQAFGWSAMLWAWLTTMLGLVRSARPRPWLRNRLRLDPQAIEKLHRTTSLTTIALMFLHAFWFFAEKLRVNEEQLGWPERIAWSFGNVFVPGVYSTGTGVIAVLLGLLAMYLAIPLGLAFYARRRIGAKTWRVLHASIVVVYVLSAWHTLLYSSTAWYDGWFRTVVWLLQLPPAGLLLIRLFDPAHRPARGGLDVLAGWLARFAVAATVVGMLLVAATGRDGGRTPGVEGAGLGLTRPVIWLGFGVFVLVVTVVVVRAHRAYDRTPDRTRDRTRDRTNDRDRDRDQDRPERLTRDPAGERERASAPPADRRYSAPRPARTRRS